MCGERKDMPLITERFAEVADVRVDERKCCGCGRCVEVCPGFPLYMQGGVAKVDQTRGFGCIACGQCMAICPDDAIEVHGRDMTPEDARKLAPFRDRASYAALSELMLARRSVRLWRDKPVTPEELEQVLRAAALAPMGLPPTDCGVLAVNGFEAVREFSDAVLAEMLKWRPLGHPVWGTLLRPFVGGATIATMRSFLIPVIDEIERRRGMGQDWLLYGAPLALFFYTSGRADPCDPVIAATFAMFAAESLGLGTCFIGTPGFAIKSSKKLRSRYGLPDGLQPGVVLLVGHAKHRCPKGIVRRFAKVTVV